MADEPKKLAFGLPAPIGTINKDLGTVEGVGDLVNTDFTKATKSEKGKILSMTNYDFTTGEDYYSQWKKKKQQRMYEKNTQAEENIAELEKDGVSNPEALLIAGEEVKVGFRTFLDFFSVGFNKFTDIGRDVFLSEEKESAVEDAIIIKKNKKKYEEDIDSSVSSGKTIMEEAQSFSDTNDIKDAESAYAGYFAENKLLFYSSQDFITKQIEINKKQEEIDAKFDKQTLEGDIEGIEKTKEEQEVLELEKLKSMFTYVDGSYSAADTKESFFDDVRSIRGAQYSDEQIYSMLSTSFKKKAAQYDFARSELQSLGLEFYARNDANMVEVPMKAIESTINKVGGVFDNSLKQTIYNNVYDGLSDEMQDADDDGRRKIRQAMSWYNQFVMTQVVSKSGLVKGGEYNDQGRQVLISSMTSPEFQALRGAFIEAAKSDVFYNENGVLDVEKFGNYMANTKEFVTFRDFFAEQKGFFSNLSKIESGIEKGGLEGGLQRAAGNIGLTSSWINNNIFNKIAQKNSTLDAKAEDIAVLAPLQILTKPIKILLGESINEDAFTDFELQRKQTDQLYGQNPWNRIKDSATFMYRTIKSNPTTNMLTAGAGYITMAGRLKKLAIVQDALVGIQTIKSPWVRNAVGLLANGALETIESLPLNVAVDSYESISNVSLGRYGIDPVVGFISWLPEIKKYGAGREFLSLYEEGFKLAKTKGLVAGSKKEIQFVEKYIRDAGFVGFSTKLSDFVDETGKIDKNKFLMATETEARRLAVDVNKEETLTRQSLVNKVEEYKKTGEGLSENGLDALYYDLQKSYPAAHKEARIASTKGGVVNKIDVVSKLLSKEKLQSDKLVELGLIKDGINADINGGYYSELQNKVDAIQSSINNARKTTKDPLQLKILDNAEIALKKAASAAVLYPYYAITGKHAEYAENVNKEFKVLTDSLLSVGVKIDDATKTSKIEDIIKMPQEILDAKGDLSKISQIISGNEKKYQQYGVKTYNMQTYMKNNRQFIEKNLGKKGYARLEKLMKTLKDINNGDVKIYELPNSIKSQINGIQGFTTFVEKGDKEVFIIGSVGTLSEILNGKAAMKKEGFIEYFTSFCHEIGHNIMLSLTPKVRSGLLSSIKTLSSTGGQDLKKLLTTLDINLSEGRIKFLERLRNSDEARFYEELAADYMGRAIHNSIMGKEGDALDIGNQIIENIQKLKGKPLTKNKDGFSIIAEKFVNMVSAVFNNIQSGTDMSEKIRATMQYMASQIVKGKVDRIDKGKQIENLKSFGTLDLKYIGEEISVTSTKSLDDLNSQLKKYGEYLVDYDVTYAKDELGVFYRKIIMIDKTPKKVYMFDGIMDAAAKAESASRAILNYEQEGKAVETMYEGITTFDIAKLYSVERVRSFVKDANVTIDALGNMLPLTYRDPVLFIEIVNGLSKKEKAKMLGAVAIAETKNNYFVGLMTKFFDAELGIINLKKEIDGVTFVDALNNIGAKVTKNGFVEFGGQDIIKFTEEGYGDILKKYMRSQLDNYPVKIQEKAKEIFDGLGYKGSLEEQYVEFTNNVMNKIYDAGVLGGLTEDQARFYSRDIVSRLFVGAPSYIGVLTGKDNFKNILANINSLVDDFAYGLTKKNAKFADVSHQTIYEKILTNIDVKDGEYADNISEIYMKDLESKELQRQRYTKDYYNTLYARGEDYIIQTLKGMDSIAMSPMNFSQFLNKVSEGGSIYTTLIKNKIYAEGLEEIIDLSKIEEFSSKDDVLAAFKEAITDSKDIIVKQKSEKIYEDVLDYISSMEKDFNNETADEVLDIFQKRFDSVIEDMSLDRYMNGIQTKEQTQERWLKDTNEMDIAAFGTKTDEYKKGVASLESPEMQKAVDGVSKFVEDFNRLSYEVSGEGFNAFFGKMLTDADYSYFKPFFNIENASVKMKVNEKIVKGFSKEYFITMEDQANTDRANGIKHIIGSILNPSTIAAKDKEVAKYIDESLSYMIKSNNVFEGSYVESFLRSLGYESKYIQTGTFANKFVDKMHEYVRSHGLTFSQVKADILNEYRKKYFFDKRAKKSLDGYVIGGTKLNGDVGYKDAINAYVEILGRRGDSIGLVDESAGREILSKIFDEMEISVPNTTLGGKEFKEAIKMQGFKGNWLGLSEQGLAKITKKGSEYTNIKNGMIYNRVFANYLYNSLAVPDVAYNLWDKIFRGARKVEQGLAKGMYTLFYNVLGTGLAAGSQQLISNRIHLMSRISSEIGKCTVDNVDELIRLTQDLLGFDVLGEVGRVELESGMMTNSRGIMKKVNYVMDRILNNTSALAWSDKATEMQVKQYAFTSALLNGGYTVDGAKSMIERASKIADDIKQAYSEYISFEGLLTRTEDNIMKSLGYRIQKEIKEGKKTLEQGVEMIDNIMGYKRELSGLSEVVSDAKYKTITFFQISSDPKLVQTWLGGSAGSMNMRFMNWATRKAGEYAYNFADAIIKKDAKRMTQVVGQILSEGLYATKLYMLINDASDGGGSLEGTMQSIYLPYVLVNMLSLKSLNIIKQGLFSPLRTGKRSEETEIEYNKRLALLGGDWGQRIKAAFVDTMDAGKGKVGSSYVYWVLQSFKILNGLADLSEKGDVSDAFTNRASAIPLVRSLIEGMGNIVQGKISKYDTLTMGGINKDYVNNYSVGTMLNMMVNGKALKNYKEIESFTNAYYSLTKTNEEGYVVNIPLVPYSSDNKMLYNAINNYIDKKGLQQFIIGGTKVPQLIKELEGVIDTEKLGEYFDASGIDKDYLSIADKALIEADNFDASGYGEFKDDQKTMDIINSKKSKTNTLILSLGLMSQGVEQEGLLSLGVSTSKESQANFETKFADIVKIIQGKIDENPSLAKAGAYNTLKWESDVAEYLNEFGEEMLVAAYIKAMSKTHLDMEKETIKMTNGKDWWKKNSKNNVELLTQLAISDNEYTTQLISEYYDLLNMGNRNIGKTLLQLYLNSAEDKPIKKILKNNTGIGAEVNLQIVQDIVKSEGQNAFGVNNIFASLNNKMWNYRDGLSKGDEQDEFTKKMLGMRSGYMDYFDNMSNTVLADNVKLGFVSEDVEHIDELKKIDPEGFERLSGDYKRYLDVMTVSNPITDEKIVDLISADILKTPGSGSKRRKIAFHALKDKLNKFSDFKTDFYRAVLKEEPLQHITYKMQGDATILPIRKSALEARPQKTEYNFIKTKEPETVKTPDIVVETVKTAKGQTSYTGKAIKGGNIYIVKTSRGQKR